MAPSYKEDDEQERQFDFDWDHETLPDYLKPFLTDDTPGTQASSPAITVPGPAPAPPPAEHATAPGAWQSAGAAPPIHPAAAGAPSTPAGGPAAAQIRAPAAERAPAPAAPAAGEQDFPDVAPFDFGAMTDNNEFDFESNTLPSWLGAPPHGPGTAAADPPRVESAGLPDWLRTPAAAPPAPAAAAEFDFNSEALPSWLASGTAAPSGAESADPFGLDKVQPFDFSAMRAPAAPAPAPLADDFYFGGLQPFDFSAMSAPAAPAAPAPTPAPPAGNFDFGDLQPFDFSAGPGAATEAGELSETNSDVDDFIAFLSVSTAGVAPPPAVPMQNSDFDLPPDLEPFSFEGLDLGMPAGEPSVAEFSSRVPATPPRAGAWPGAPARAEASPADRAAAGAPTPIPPEPGPSDLGDLAGDEFNFEPFMFDQGAADVAFQGAPAPGHTPAPFGAPPTFNLDMPSGGASGSGMPPGLEDLPDLQPFSFEDLDLSNSGDFGSGTRGSDQGYSRRSGDYDSGRGPLPFSFEEESAASAEDVHNFSWQRRGAAARPAPLVPEVPDSSTSIFAKARKRKEELEQALRRDGDTQDAAAPAPPVPPPPSPEETADLVYWPSLDEDAPQEGPAEPAPLVTALESAPPAPAPSEQPAAPAAAELLWSIPVAEAHVAPPPTTNWTGTDEAAASDEFDFSGLQPLDLGALELTPEERAYLMGAPTEEPLGIPELQTLDQDIPSEVQTQDIEPFSFDAAAFAVPAEPEVVQPALPVTEPAAPAAAPTAPVAPVSPVGAASWSEMTGDGIFDFSDLVPAPATETPAALPEPAPVAAEAPAAPSESAPVTAETPAAPPEPAPITAEGPAAAVAAPAPVAEAPIAEAPAIAAPAAPVPVAPPRTSTAPLTEPAVFPVPPMPAAEAPAIAAPAASAMPEAPPPEAPVVAEAPAPPIAAPTRAPATPAAAPAGSIDELVRYLDTSPDDAAARLALAVGYEHREDYTRAAEQYKKLIKGRDVPANMIEIVVDNLRELVETQPDNPALHRLLGDAYMKQDQFQMAINQYNWLLTKGSR